MRTQSRIGLQKLRLVGTHFTLCLLAGLFASCAQPTEPLSVVAGVQALGVTGGGIPIPVDSVKHLPAWDGTYAELLAADAFATCYKNLPTTALGTDFTSSLETNTQKALFGYTGSPNTSVPPTDTFLAGLQNKMANTFVACVPAQPFLSTTATIAPGYNVYDLVLQDWLWYRNNRSNQTTPFAGGVYCNVSPVDGAQADLDLSAGTQYPASYVLESSGSFASLVGAKRDRARLRVQSEVSYAYLNLCMVEQLRQHLSSEQVVHASTESLVELQAIIKERAMAAVQQYTMLVHAINKWSTLNPTSVSIVSEDFVAPVFALWAGMLGGAQQQLGEDLALAVSRLVEATSEQLDLLVRTGEPETSVGTYDGGVAGGPRLDALRALYGAQWDAKATITAEDFSDPRVPLLLNFARGADALMLVGLGGTAPPTYPSAFTVDIEASAARLLEEVEADLREKECDWDDESPYCNPTDPDLPVLLGRHEIRHEHARSLVKGLIELALGSASVAGPTVLFDPLPPLANLGRVSGTHIYVSPFSFGGQTRAGIKLDRAFVVMSLARAAASQAYALLPARTWDSRMLPEFLGFASRTMTQDTAWTFLGVRAATAGSTPGLWGTSDVSHRPVPRFGAISTLAAVAELGATIGTGLNSLFNAGREAFVMARAAIGDRVILIRPRVTAVENSSYCFAYYQGAAQGSCLADSPILSGGHPTYDVTIVADMDEADTTLHTTGAQVTPATTPFTLDDAPNDSFVGVANAVVTIPRAATSSISLASSEELASEQFEGLVLGPFYDKQTIGKVLTTDGDLGRAATLIVAENKEDWSRPVYDPLGLPTTWNPTGDASLHGGQVGEESYQYFLRAARDAATEASNAIGTAFEGLKAAEQDELARAQADERASELKTLEVKALCGKVEACPHTDGLADALLKNSTQEIKLPDPCPNDEIVCRGMKVMMANVFGARDDETVIKVAVASPVKSILNSNPPSFQAYAGGTLEKLFLAQWSAWQNIQRELKSVAAASKAGADELDRATAELNDAQVNLTATKAENDASLKRLEVQNLQQVQQVKQAESALIPLFAQQASLVKRHKEQCEGGGFIKKQGQAIKLRDAYRACTGSPPASDPFDVDEQPRVATNGAQKECERIVGSVIRSENLGPEIQQCWDIEGEQRAVHDQIVGTTAAIDDLKRNLLQQGWGNFVANYGESNARFTRAVSRKSVATYSWTAVEARVQSSMVESLDALSAAWEAYLQTLVDIRTAVKQTQLAKARVDLDAKLDKDAIQLRFDLRRKYDSYDLWRARALSESARRLAVAARRAIESRFVVDLSRLGTPEPFVEAPAVWADEVYGSDFKPPTSLGRTSGPEEVEGALYTSKLLDYVNNLDLFVKGYAVARPTSIAKQDIEVIQLPGPGRIIGNSGSDRYLDPESGGWAFYCPQAGSWIANPNRGAFGVTDGSLAQACNGLPPTKARIAFWLDPWGGLYGSVANPPYQMRHNARWSRLAVNLVGAGVRDCSQASDAPACYAEPFIRYDLRQLGPTMITDYRETWHELDIPLAVIEGAKALATEEWLDPVSNAFNLPTVSNVGRYEYMGRPLGGNYELTFELTPDVRVERIDRIQVLAETDYWVRQLRGDEVGQATVAQCGDGIVEGIEICDFPVNGTQPVKPPENTPYPVCPLSCDDLDPSTKDTMTGVALLCTSSCSHEPITACITGDGYCPPETLANPAGCDEITDADCAAGALVSWKSGTYTGTSQAYVWDETSGTLHGKRNLVDGRVEPFPAGIAPVIRRGVERFVQMEGARSNVILQSRNWQAMPWLAFGATVLPDQYSSLDDAYTASKVTYTITPGSVSQPSNPSISGWSTVSRFYRSLDESADWERSATTLNLTDHTGGLTLEGGPTDSGLFDFLQFEVGSFPSSPIVTTTSTVTRAANSLELPASSLPNAMRTGTWRVRVIPYFASGDTLDSATTAPVLSFVDGSTAKLSFVLYPNGMAGSLKIQAEGFADIDVPGTWGRYEELEILVDAYRSRVTFSNLSNPQSETVSIFDLPPIDASWSLQVGHKGTNHNFFGLISEPTGSEPTPGFGATLVGTSPLDGATNVGLSGPITLTFDTPVHLPTINSTTLTLKDSNGNDIPYTPSVGTGTQILLTPNSPLSLLTRYTVGVTAGVLDTTETPSEEAEFDFVTRDGVWQTHVVHQSLSSGVRKGPYVKHSANGDAVVAWAIDASVYALELTNGVFGTPFLLNSPSANIGSMSLSVAPDGKVLVAWGYVNGANIDLRVARRESNGSWASSDLAYSVASTTVSSVWCAINSAGHMVASIRNGSTLYVVYKNDGDPSWTFTSAPITTHTNMAIVAADDGAFHIVGEAGTLNWSARTPPGASAWTTPQTTLLGTDNPGGVGATNLGNNLIVIADVASTGPVKVIERVANVWQSSISLTSGAANARSIAGNARGDALALWRTTGTLNHRAYRPAGGSWSAVSQYSVITGANDYPACGAVDPVGNAAIFFTTTTGTSQEVHRYNADAAAWTSATAGSIGGTTLGDIFGRLDDCNMSVAPSGKVLVAGARTTTAFDIRTVRFE